MTLDFGFFLLNFDPTQNFLSPGEGILGSSRRRCSEAKNSVCVCGCEPWAASLATDASTLKTQSCQSSVERRQS